MKKNIISNEDKDDDNDSESDHVLRLLHDEGVKEAAGSNVGHLSHVQTRQPGDDGDGIKGRLPGQGQPKCRKALNR